MNDWRYNLIAVCNAVAAFAITALIIIALSVVVAVW